MKSKEKSKKLDLLHRGIKESPDFVPFYESLYHLSNKNENLELLETLKKGVKRTNSYSLAALIAKYYEYNQDFENAISTYEDYIKLPEYEIDKINFYHSLAVLNFKVENFQKSIKFFKKILSLDSNQWETYIHIIYVNLYIGKDNSSLKFIEKLQMEDGFFRVLFMEKLIWLEGQIPFEIEDIIDFNQFVKSLKNLKKKVDGELKKKINFLLILVLKRTNKIFQRVQLLRQCTNEYSPDYLQDELLETR